MKIVVDARLMGEGFGIGVYTRELALRLPKIAPQHEFVFLVRAEQEKFAKEQVIGEHKNAKMVVCDIPHYSWQEQIKLPGILKKLKPDLVHFPNFNVPIFYNGKFVVTIHDMVHHKIKGHRRGSSLRHIAYKMVMGHAVENSDAIIAVSRSSKQQITELYPKLNSEKIYVIHEGVSPEFNPQELPGEIYTLHEKYKIEQPYILFVGVWEVKKNLPFLAMVFKEIAPKFPDLRLVLAGKPDPWHPEVGEQVMKSAGRYHNRIITPGFIQSADLPALYRQAEVFANPSPNEGFGLPALEAMSSGTPVVVADTQVFREVYEEGAVYFDYSSVENAAKTLADVLSNEGKQAEMVNKGLDQAAKYKWEEAVLRTTQLYEEIYNF